MTEICGISEGHGEAAVPVEVGPERGQTDQPGRAREIGVHPSGELDVALVCLPRAWLTSTSRSLAG